MQHQRNAHRLDLRDNPDEWAAGAHVTSYDGTTWGEHGETDLEHRDKPYSNHSGPGQVKVEYHAEYAEGSPFLVTLEGPWGPDATATMTRAEAESLHRILEVLLLDSDPNWHAHNAAAEAEIRGES